MIFCLVNIILLQIDKLMFADEYVQTSIHAITTHRVLQIEIGDSIVIPLIHYFGDFR